MTEAGCEVSVSAHGTGHQANVFQFIHRVATGQNVDIEDTLGEAFKRASDDILETLYSEAKDIALAMAKGLASDGLVMSDGSQIPEEFFLQLMEGDSNAPSDLSLLRLTHCRALDMSGRNVAGCTMSHTDLNAFTLLSAPTREGLQIWYEDKDAPANSGWVQLDAPADRFAYIVNFADQVDIVTGSYLRSTPHRVVSPIGEDRYSIISFVGFQRDVDLCTGKLLNPANDTVSRFAVEAALRMPGQAITAESFTDLRKADIGLIPRDIAEQELGFIPLDTVGYREPE